MPTSEFHIHQYYDVRTADGKIRKKCSICGKMK